MGRRPNFRNRSALEKVVTQRSFKIGDELAHHLSLRHTEGSGCGLTDRFKFRDMAGMRPFVRLEFELRSRGLSRSMLDCRLGFVRDRSREEVIAQGRLEIRNEFLKHSGRRLNYWRLRNGRLGNGRFDRGWLNVQHRLNVRFRDRLWFRRNLLDDGRGYFGRGWNLVDGEFGGRFIGGEFGNGFDSGNLFHFRRSGLLRSSFDFGSKGF